MRRGLGSFVLLVLTVVTKGSRTEEPTATSPCPSRAQRKQRLPGCGLWGGYQSHSPGRRQRDRQTHLPLCPGEAGAPALPPPPPQGQGHRRLTEGTGFRIPLSLVAPEGTGPE